jgi:hypothetical protein
MAKGKATPSSFKKGDPRAIAAGQKSSRALPPDLKDARAIRAIEFEQIIYRYLDKSPAEIDVLLKANKDGNNNYTLPAKDLIVLKLVKLAIDNGDLARLGFLLDRTIGPLQSSVKVDATMGVYKLHDAIMEKIRQNDK